jgi:hypothetical protein
MQYGDQYPLIITVQFNIFLSMYLVMYLYYTSSTECPVNIYWTMNAQDGQLQDKDEQSSPTYYSLQSLHCADQVCKDSVTL